MFQMFYYLAYAVQLVESLFPVDLVLSALAVLSCFTEQTFNINPKSWFLLAAVSVAATIFP